MTSQGHLKVKAGSSESDISVRVFRMVTVFLSAQKNHLEEIAGWGNITHFLFDMFSLNDEKCGKIQLALLLSSMSLHSHWDWKCLIHMH